MFDAHKTQDTTSYNPAMDLRNIIHLFKETIETLYAAGKDNIVIGGAHALLVHGLNMSRLPNDLDVVVYKPTEKQIEILRILAPFDIIKDRPEQDYGPGTTFKAYKFEKKGYYLDILVEQDDVPHSLLIFKAGEQSYQLQSIKGVMDAKRRYFHEKPAHGYNPSTMNKYIRDKDVIDFLDLKNCNFNL